MTRKSLFSASLLLCTLAGRAQTGSVGIGTTAPDASAVVDMTSTTKGMLLPRMSTAERVAIQNPATGLLVFQNDVTSNFYYYNGTNWSNFAGQLVGVNGALMSVVTLAGSGSSTYTDGTGTGATFYYPAGIATDASGILYVADLSNNRIRKITPAGVVTTLAGGNGTTTTSGSSGYVDATGTAAAFYVPNGIAIDASGNLYVTEQGNNRIRKVTPAGVVTTLAGGNGTTTTSGSAGYVNATGTAAAFSNPTGIAMDASGNLYVSDYSNNRIRKVTPTGVVTTFAGGNGTTTTAGSSGYVDATGTAAAFSGPSGIAIDASGNLYVADGGNNRIRKITTAGVVTTLAGGNGTTTTAGSSGYVDATGTAAAFSGPSGIAIDASGNLYVADGGNNRIRKITTAGAVSTFAGGGSGFINGPLLSAGFNNPYGLVLDPTGFYLYVTEYSGNRVRKVNVQ